MACFTKLFFSGSVDAKCSDVCLLWCLFGAGDVGDGSAGRLVCLSLKGSIEWGTLLIFNGKI